jgi:hypothetical protein
MTDPGSSGKASELAARVARLESDVAYIHGDLTKVKSTLNRLAPRIDEVLGFLHAKCRSWPSKAELANFRNEIKGEIADFRSKTKAELANLRSETKAGPPTCSMR